MSEQEASPVEVLLPDDLAGDTARLFVTRWIAGVLVLLATLFSTHVLGLPLPELPLYVLGVVVLAYNGLLLHLSHRAAARTPTGAQRLVIAQVVLDWIGLAVFLHLTGGIVSPAIPFLVIHMLIIAILLPGWSQYIYAASGVILLALIAALEIWGVLPHRSVIPALPPDLYRSPIYIGAVLIFFSITVFAAVILTSDIIGRLRRREGQIRALLQTTQTVSSTLSLPEVMDHLARSAAWALSAPGASIRLLDESGEYLTMTAAYGLSQDYWSKGAVNLSRSQLDQDALLGGPIIISETADEPRLQYPKQVLEEGIHSMLVVPIVGRGRPLGVLRVYSDQPGRFTADDAAFVMAIAQQGATALENALAHDALQRADQERAQFVRLVTHELRAPVGAAQSLLRTLTRGLAGELTDEQRDILARLERRLDTLLDLINDLLALAASKTIGLQEAPQRLPLQPIARQVIERWKHQAEEKQVSLHADLPHETLAVLATEDGLTRILDNLVGNAVKYTPSGGKVTIRVVERPAGAVISVSDTGIGIPTDELNRLWGEFFRASNARQSGIPGTGLGLSIVKRLVEHYGGLISVQSVEGEGTTFKVTLPLASPGE